MVSFCRISSMEERLICNQLVRGSSPRFGFIIASTTHGIAFVVGMSPQGVSSV